MEVTIPVTQLRTSIAHILKRLRENPDLVFKITHHKEIIAELKVPEDREKRGTDTSTEQEIAAFVDTFLKGGLPKKKGAYQRLRRLCKVPADQLPYESVDEAMEAIRGRGYGAGRL